MDNFSDDDIPEFNLAQELRYLELLSAAIARIRYSISHSSNAHWTSEEQAGAYRALAELDALFQSIRLRMISSDRQ